MALSDLMLKAKVNLALARDPRVSSLDIGVHVADGLVKLTGDVDDPTERAAASQIAAHVEGVRGVSNEMTSGEGVKQDTAQLVSQRFLEKLEEEWNDLPEQTALAQADYLQWALWMIYKFRVPDFDHSGQVAETEAKTTDEAIKAVAGHVGASAALLALELQRCAENAISAGSGDAVHLIHADLATSPLVDEGNTELAA